jgi:hypothetical protein
MLALFHDGRASSVDFGNAELSTVERKRSSLSRVLSGQREKSWFPIRIIGEIIIKIDKVTA